MKTRLLPFLALLICSGCSSVYGTRVLPDGSKLQVASHRLFWASQGIDASVRDTNGFTFNLKVNMSNPDAQSLGAVAEGAARGAVQAAKVIRLKKGVAISVSLTDNPLTSGL